MSRPILVILFLVFSSLVHSQEVTVVNHFEGDTTGRNVDDFVIKTTENHTIVVNYFEPASVDQLGRLKELMGTTLYFYIDQNILLKDDVIRFEKAQNTILKDLNAIVNDAVGYYQFMELEDFNGFSLDVEKKLENLDGLKINEADIDIDNVTPEQRLAFIFNQKLNVLKHQMDYEISRYANDNFIVYSGSGLEDVTEEQLQQIQELDSFKTNDPLEPIEVDFSVATQSLLASDDEFYLPSFEEFEGPQDDFAERVFEMLEAQNKKFDSLADEMKSIREEQAAQKQEIQNISNAYLQQQINELRDAILAIAEGNSAPITSVPDSPASVTTFNLPSKVDVLFASGSVSFNLNAQYQLNEIVAILAQNPSKSCIVTGFADKTGNPQSNIRLSQRRAEAVRSFMTRSGIASDRIVMNYFGDRESGGAKSTDRKVEIKFIN